MAGRESLVKSTCASSLVWDENTERAVDRMTAIGMVARNNELGAAMLHAEALDAVALRKVVLLVVRHLHHTHRIARGFGEKIAIAVMREYMQPGCPTCGGQREIRNEGEAVHICAACGGTGVHRYTDSSREGMIGGRYNKAAYESALRQVRDAMAGVVSAANGRLG
jgi:hypothetical protein